MKYRIDGFKSCILDILRKRNGLKIREIHIEALKLFPIRFGKLKSVLDLMISQKMVKREISPDGIRTYYLRDILEDMKNGVGLELDEGDLNG